jgi:hypothetical protein
MTIMLRFTSCQFLLRPSIASPRFLPLWPSCDAKLRTKLLLYSKSYCRVILESVTNSKEAVARHPRNHSPQQSAISRRNRLFQWLVAVIGRLDSMRIDFDADKGIGSGPETRERIATRSSSVKYRR